MINLETKSLLEVYELIQQRASAMSAESYVASLLRGGLDKILKKVGEEATEVVLAAKNTKNEELIHEITDLWFHVMVLMVSQGIPISAVEAEFGRRFGVSGLAEKAQRTKNE